MEQTVNNRYITGFHAIEEKILSFDKAKEKNTELVVYYSKLGPRVKKIIEASNKNKIKVVNVDDKTLDSFVENLSEGLKEHRGIVLEVSGENKPTNNLVDFEQWAKNLNAKENLEKTITVVILDKVTDPHNVGAIIRSCDQFGADLVVLPEHKSANNIESNEIIMRSSAGASSWVPVSIVNNLVRVTEILKDNDFWVYGADAGGENCASVSFSKRRAIVMGSEGSGMSSLLKKQCDKIVSIPTCGKIDSLNVSVAAGVLLYELFCRQN